MKRRASWRHPDAERVPVTKRWDKGVNAEPAGVVILALAGRLQRAFLALRFVHPYPGLPRVWNAHGRGASLPLRRCADAKRWMLARAAGLPTVPQWSRRPRPSGWHFTCGCGRRFDTKTRDRRRAERQVLRRGWVQMAGSHTFSCSQACAQSYERALAASWERIEREDAEVPASAVAFAVWPIYAVEQAELVHVSWSASSVDHLACHAALAFDRGRKRRPVVCVRRTNEGVIHYVSVFGPEGVGAYATYLGTTRPQSVAWVEDV